MYGHLITSTLLDTQYTPGFEGPMILNANALLAQKVLIEMLNSLPNNNLAPGRLRRTRFDSLAHPRSV